MKISVRWLNEYLEPGDVSAEEAERVLTFAGFPIETAETLPSGDTCLDVEVTSNRGDVLSHIGVAREIAASTGRRLKLPAAGKVFNWSGEGDVGPGPAPVGGTDVGGLVAVDNRVPASCPLFTARVIRGVKVGPSPAWMRTALESVGLRPINSVVDVTNFVAFEYGQPTHVFDMDTLARGTDGKVRLVVRAARKGEKLAMLDGRSVTLAGDEIVVVDAGAGEGADAAVSLAGVMGGEGTGVTERTVDVLLEAATWAPLDVRRTARRFNVRTDASYRFERVVDPRTIEVAARRAAALIVRLAGGRPLPGVIHAGAEPAPPAQVRLRPGRCRAIIGENIATPEIQRLLEAHEIQVKPEAASAGVGGTAEPVLACTIPPHRPDLEREIDLIEEVARTHGLDKLPVHEKIAARVAAPQLSERAVRDMGGVLNGLGFFEAVTFTFVSAKAAKPFLPSGLEAMQVCDDRRAADPVLRPSAIPSLLACRRANQDRGADEEAGVGDAGVRLYEVSSVFAQEPAQPGTPGGPKAPARGRGVERVNLALVADCSLPVGAKAHEQRQAGLRLVRGAVEAVAAALGGEGVKIEIVPRDNPFCAAYDPATLGEVVINGRTAGFLGLLAPSVQSQFGLEAPVACAEIELAQLVALYPPRSTVKALPAFPAIERDLSLIVAEGVRWAQIDALVAGLAAGMGQARPEAWSFVTAYRGQQTGPGRKSVTLRMRFRDPGRTLTHDEVSPQVEAIAAAARKDLGAEIRTA